MSIWIKTKSAVRGMFGPKKKTIDENLVQMTEEIIAGGCL